MLHMKQLNMKAAHLPHVHRSPSSRSPRPSQRPFLPLKEPLTCFYIENIQAFSSTVLSLVYQTVFKNRIKPVFTLMETK